MVASATSHRESLGAGSMLSTGVLNREYWSQIFAALKQTWEDTRVAIERLEQQVLLPARYLAEKLAVTTPKAKLVGQAALPTAPTVIQRPGAKGPLSTWKRFVVS